MAHSFKNQSRAATPDPLEERLGQAKFNGWKNSLINDRSKALRARLRFRVKRAGIQFPEYAEATIEEKDEAEADPKLAERRPNETVFKWCNVCSADDLRKPSWCTHPEADGPAEELLFDGKYNRGVIELEGKEDFIEQPKLRGKLGTLFRMIHPRNLCCLLTENVEEAAKNWIVFTTNGTLLGYSEGTTIRQGRTVAALTGAAWRINNDRILNGSSEAPHSGNFLTNVQVFPYDEAEAGLKSMFAEVDGMVIAVHDIKERLLVAAMIPLNALEPPPANKPLERMESLQIFEETETVAKETAASSVVKEAIDNISSSSSGSHLTTSTEGSTGSAQDKGKGRDMGGEDEEGGEEKLSKKDLLMLKAEGMVEVLLEDLKDFVMPNEFY